MTDINEAIQEKYEPLPSTIFVSIMGLPMTDRDQFIGFKNRILGTARAADLSPEQVMAERMEAVVWMQQYFNRDLDARQAELTARDDMIGWLLTTEVDNERLTREEVLDILGLLMIAGLDTVAASLACFLSYFARNPEQRERIIANPALIPSAIKELMRFESPVTEGMRRVVGDVTLPSGTALASGSWLMGSWSAANLDPVAFPDPLAVDFDREPNPHIGFASGFHRCLGSHLARMEMSAAIAVWHERIPSYHIAAGHELVYSGNPRAPFHLPSYGPEDIAHGSAVSFRHGRKDLGTLRRFAFSRASRSLASDHAEGSGRPDATDQDGLRNRRARHR